MKDQEDPLSLGPDTTMSPPDPGRIGKRSFQHPVPGINLSWVSLKMQVGTCKRRNGPMPFGKIKTSKVESMCLVQYTT